MKEGPDLRFSTYLSQRPGLIEYAARMLGSREAAEDILQEAYLRFVPEASGSPLRHKSYLFRIVHNLAVDMLRRKKLERRSRMEDTPTWAAPPPMPTPEETVLFCESVRRAMDIIADLPKSQRVALEMHRFGGYPPEQIAAHLGVSVPTVYRLVQTAVATLTLRLRQDPADPRPS